MRARTQRPEEYRTIATVSFCRFLAVILLYAMALTHRSSFWLFAMSKLQPHLKPFWVSGVGPRPLLHLLTREVWDPGTTLHPLPGKGYRTVTIRMGHWVTHRPATTQMFKRAESPTPTEPKIKPRGSRVPEIPPSHAEAL